MLADPRPLFVVAGVVIAGLAMFVAYVLAKVPERWARTSPPAATPPASPPAERPE